MNKVLAIVLIILVLITGSYFFMKSFSKLESSSTQPTLNCDDSDEGLNYDIKGTTYNVKAYGVKDLQNFTDVCTNEVDKDNSLYEPTGYLIEYNCNTPEGSGEIYECPKGCHDGACIK